MKALTSVIVNKSTIPEDFAGNSRLLTVVWCTKAGFPPGEYVHVKQTQRWRHNVVSKKWEFKVETKAT